MLVLARRSNQSIMIGDDIEIVIVDIHGDQVKLGIQAPREIAVHRKEIYEEIQKENIRAAEEGVQDKIDKALDILTLHKEKSGKK